MKSLFFCLILLCSSKYLGAQAGATVEGAVDSSSKATADMQLEVVSKQKAWESACAPCISGTGSSSSCQSSVLPLCPDGQKKPGCCLKPMRDSCISECNRINSINWSSILMGAGVAAQLSSTALNLYGRLSGSGGSGNSGDSLSTVTPNAGNDPFNNNKLFSGDDVTNRCGKMTGKAQTKCYCEGNGWTFDSAKGSCNDSPAPDKDKGLGTGTTSSSLASNADAKGLSPSGSDSAAGGGQGAASPGGGNLNPGSLSLREMDQANRNKIGSGSSSGSGSHSSSDSGSDDFSAISDKNAQGQASQKDKKKEEDRRIEIARSSDDIFFIVNKPIRIRYDYNQMLSVETIKQGHGRRM